MFEQRKARIRKRRANHDTKNSKRQRNPNIICSRQTILCTQRRDSQFKCQQSGLYERACMAGTKRIKYELSNCSTILGDNGTARRNI